MRLKMFLYVIVACCWGKTLSIPQHILNEFKSNLLPLFGLKDRPKLEGQKPHVPDTLKKLYELQNNLEFETASLPLPGLHTRSANTVRSFVHVESPIDAKFTSPHKFRLKFDPASIPAHERLKAAQIHLPRQALPSPQPLHRLLIHDILKPGIRGSHPPLLSLMDSQIVNITSDDPLVVDVYPAAERWLRDPSSNHGVLVVLRAASSTPAHLLLRPGDEANRPVFYAYTDDGRNRQRSKEELGKLRPKRAAGRRHRKNERDPCRRRQMYVDFKDVGWSDWIVAPLGYDAFYCGGECDYPMPEHLNTTNHAIVQSLVNSVKPAEVPKPCCVPTHLSAMSMLYVGNDGAVILKNYKDMVVEGCGCR